MDWMIDQPPESTTNQKVCDRERKRQPSLEPWLKPWRRFHLEVNLNPACETADLLPYQKRKMQSVVRTPNVRLRPSQRKSDIMTNLATIVNEDLVDADWDLIEHPMSCPMRI